MGAGFSRSERSKNDLLIMVTAQNPAFRRLGGGVVEGATLEEAMVSSILGSDKFIEQDFVARQLKQLSRGNFFFELEGSLTRFRLCNLCRFQQNRRNIEDQQAHVLLF